MNLSDPEHGCVQQPPVRTFRRATSPLSAALRETAKKERKLVEGDVVSSVIEADGLPAAAIAIANYCRRDLDAIVDRPVTHRETMAITGRPAKRWPSPG
jgi:hypothetical protein